MQAFVFTDGALARHAGRFVWLSVDVDREENAAFLEKFPISSLPTLLVLEPQGEVAALKYAGAATVAQLEKLLEEGERAARSRAEGLEQRLAEADRESAAGRRGEALGLYRALLAEAPADWPPRPRLVEAVLLGLLIQGAGEECVRIAQAELPGLPRVLSYANAALFGLDCAIAAPKEAPWRPQALAALEAHARDALTGAPPIALSADDRSGLYEVLVRAREAAGDEEGKRALAREWASFLEAEAARASTPAARTVFDSHRMLAYRALGEPARALPMLEAAERELPGDYNPPARLASVLRTLGRHDEALAANDRALALVYGPRRLRVMMERAEILLARGDRTGARQALEDALAFFRSLPKAQASEATRARIQQKLDELK